MFLFGMKIMSEGLQKVAGKKMRQILGIVSNNRFIGCGVGTLVTSVIQSSSATTVMLVGFVDAGLMTLQQAIGVILGANIGTTVTAQLIAFRIQDYALPAIALGAILKFFSGSGKRVYVGDVFLGFGLLFYGLVTMKAGFAPLKDEPVFISFFTKFQAGTLPGLLLCVSAGTVLTMILQSSSATVGITMALASQGLIDFPASVALILGDNIGTTITAQLASMGAKVNARRTANAHTFFNLMGVIIIILLFPAFQLLVISVTSSFSTIGSPDVMIDGEYIHISRYIANSHTFFNVVNALIFLLILPYLVRVAVWVTPHRKETRDLDELHQIKFIDFKFIDAPAVAIQQAKAEIMRMGDAVKIMFDDVVYSLKGRKRKELSKWRKREDHLDNLQREITQFLVQVIQKPILPEESKEVTSLMRMTNNLERIGDGIENIAELMEELFDQNLQFSEGGLHDYDTMAKEVRNFLEFVVQAIRDDNREVMASAEQMEERINTMREEMKGNHLMRLQSAICTVDPGLILVDMLTAFEKMGDYCFNISQALAGVKYE